MGQQEQSGKFTVAEHEGVRCFEVPIQDVMVPLYVSVVASAVAEPHEILWTYMERTTGMPDAVRLGVLKQIIYQLQQMVGQAYDLLHEAYGQELRPDEVAEGRRLMEDLKAKLGAMMTGEGLTEVMRQFEAKGGGNEHDQPDRTV